MSEDTTTDLVFNAELDLLVDGALSEDRREAFLRRLEEEPDGWRQCARRFLEAQVWREAFALAEEAEPKVVRSRSGAWQSLAAAVLGFLVAVFFYSGAGSPGSFGGVASGEPGESQAQEALSTPEPEVRILPYPVYTDRGFVPASDERGNVFYRGEGVPAVVLRALKQAGHGVERVERMIHVPREEGEPLELPVTETRVFINHEL